MISATIRYELGDSHTYEYIEGTIPHPLAPGLSGLISEETEAFTLVDTASVQSCTQALHGLERFISEVGPFDGVIGFSNGAALAATFMIHKDQKHQISREAYPIFKCAIFFSGGIPGDPAALQRQEIRSLNPNEDGIMIKIPTAHIWGANDHLYPDFGPVLRGLCQGDLREEFVHQGGHEVPGAKDKTGVANSVRIIKRTIERALIAQ